jgi:predicted regulator of Ras-like GTPase activity (Roadblock/LC7/MglB family)
MSSPFGAILSDLVRAIPRARGAVFVDWEGEAVDQVSAGEHDLRLLGAHWSIAYHQARAALDKLGLGAPEELVLRFQHEQILVRRVTEDYLVLLAMGSEENLGRALHLLRQSGRLLRSEM